MCMCVLNGVLKLYNKERVGFSYPERSAKDDPTMWQGELSV